MAYRAVKSNTSNQILAIGMDEDQGGRDYNGIGTWLDWTFETMPEPSQDVKDHIAKLREQGLEYTLPTIEISEDGKSFVQVSVSDVAAKADTAISAAKAVSVGKIG